MSTNSTCADGTARGVVPAPTDAAVAGGRRSGQCRPKPPEVPPNVRRDTIEPIGQSARLVREAARVDRPLQRPQALGLKAREPPDGLEKSRSDLARITSCPRVLQAVPAQPGVKLVVRAELDNGPGERVG